MGKGMGILVSLSGLDGSGKTTQGKKIMELCLNNGIKAHYVHLKTIDTKESYINVIAEAKQYAKTMDKRTDWDMIKEKIMYKVVKQKFIQNSSLGQKLLDTENAYLIEGNNWGDQFWGICPVVGDVGIDGLNMLGTILMIIRNELKPLPKTPIA